MRIPVPAVVLAVLAALSSVGQASALAAPPACKVPDSGRPGLSYAAKATDGRVFPIGVASGSWGQFGKGLAVPLNSKILSEDLALKGASFQIQGVFVPDEDARWRVVATSGADADPDFALEVGPRTAKARASDPLGRPALEWVGDLPKGRPLSIRVSTAGRGQPTVRIYKAVSGEFQEVCAVSLVSAR